MLLKQNRLKKKNDFDKVVKQGKYVSERFLILKFAENQLENTRIGFVVSKKISKKAVQRNKIKRRLREVCRQELSALKTGFDVIFFAKQSINTGEFIDIQNTVKQLFKKSNLYA